MWHVNYSPIDHFKSRTVWITPSYTRLYTQTMWLLIAVFFFIIIRFSVVIMRIYTPFGAFSDIMSCTNYGGATAAFKKEKSVIVLLPFMFIESEFDDYRFANIYITPKQSKIKSVYKLAQLFNKLGLADENITLLCNSIDNEISKRCYCAVLF